MFVCELARARAPVCGCPRVGRVDGAQLSELSITLPGDEIRMLRGHTAPIWNCADKSAASWGVSVCGRIFVGGCVCVCVDEEVLGLKVCVLAEEY